MTNALAFMFGKALNILVSTGKPPSCFVSPWPCAAAEMYDANMQDECYTKLVWLKIFLTWNLIMLVRFLLYCKCKQNERKAPGQLHRGHC